MIRLDADDWLLELEPQTGGSIRTLSWQGHGVLVRNPQAPHPVLQNACFPMVPFASRMVDGRLPFNGKTYPIKAYGVASPVMPLHGTGWMRSWEVMAQDGASAELRLVHAPDAYWPWPFEARQSFQIRDNRMAAVLTVRSLTDEPWPVSIGHHPWFETAEARISAITTSAWAPGPKGVCDQLQPAPLVLHGTDPADLVLDHTLGGWSGAAIIARPHLTTALTSRQWRDDPAQAVQTPWLHLYAPQGGPRFCLEPETARSGAFEVIGDGEAGVVILTAEQPCLSVSMEVTVERAAPG